MGRFSKAMSILMVAAVLFACIPSLATMEDISPAHGQEDLSRLTYEELLTLQSDISSAYKTYHVPTDSQKNSVLGSTQSEAQKYYSDKGLEVSGWAWYDSEYTYTKEWDFYTLKTHLDYKDSNKKSHKAIIYSEVYNKDGKFFVAYLKAEDTVVIDTRSDYGDALWFSQPSPCVNVRTNIDLSTYTVQELNTLNDKAKKEIESNHSVSKNEASVILTLTKSDLEQYCLKKGIEIKSYAWYDSEYTYIRDWDYYWLETHVDYKESSNSSQKTSKLYSEVCKIDGNYELVFLKMGDTVIKDRKGELSESSDDGIPRYHWASTGENASEKQPEESNRATVADVTPQIVYVTPEPGAEVTPQIIYVTAEPGAEATPEKVYITPEPAPEITPQIIYVTPAPVEGVFYADLTELTDDQLAEAADAIRAEQRARIKTKITLSETSITLLTGKSQKIEASIVDLPEGEKAPKLEWSTSDKNIATIANGQIRGVAGGSAIITCSATLADGTYIYEECAVQVNIPVNSIGVDIKSLNLSGGESAQPVFTIKPDNASIQALSFESSDENVVTVDKNGKITGVGDGTAKVTVSSTDGSNKSVVITVKVVDHRISKDTAQKVVYTGIGNYSAEDVYTSDGMYYDKKKFHPYGYLAYNFSVVDEGTWTTKDGGNTWHVEDLLLQHRIYNGYFMYDFDVRFDGKNYYMENGWLENAGQLKWLRSKDPSKWGESDLSNLEFYTCFVISPALLE